MRLFRKRRPTLPLLCSVLTLTILLTSMSAAQSSGQRRSSSRQTRSRLYSNPVFDTDFPDPTVVRASDGYYYAYATQTVRDGRMINIQVARSHDLVQWEHLGDALPVKPAWANQTQKLWAPHVSQHGDTFYMYYSA